MDGPWVRLVIPPPSPSLFSHTRANVAVGRSVCALLFPHSLHPPSLFVSLSLSCSRYPAGSRRAQMRLSRQRARAKARVVAAARDEFPFSSLPSSYVRPTFFLLLFSTARCDSFTPPPLMPSRQSHFCTSPAPLCLRFSCTVGQLFLRFVKFAEGTMMEIRPGRQVCDCYN